MNSTTIPKKYLDPETKFKVAYYFKHLTPILAMSLKVAGDLSLQIKDLEMSVKNGEVSKKFSEHFQKFVNEHNLLKEINREQFQYLLHDTF